MPAALFLMVLAGFHERTGIAATLAVVLAVLLTATAALGATVRRLPEQLGILLPVAIAPAAVVKYGILSYSATDRMSRESAMAWVPSVVFSTIATSPFLSRSTMFGRPS